MKLQDFLNEANQVKASEKKPSIVKPTKSNQSKHPYQGRLVGSAYDKYSEAEEPKDNTPARTKLDHSLRAQGHKVEKDRKKEFKKGAVKHKGKQFDEGTYVADRGEIIDYILKEIRKEAYEDIGLIKHLAKLINKTVQVRRHKHKKEGGVLQLEMKNQVPFDQCPKCGDAIFHESEGKKDACYHKVKSRYKVWPSAYASGALVQCRKKGAKNWGNKSKKK